MIEGLFGKSTVVSMLKSGLDTSSRRVQDIAQRIANATTPGFRDYPSLAEESAIQQPEEIDVEREMVALADEQLRFDAAARLLQMNYAQIRSSIREG